MATFLQKLFVHPGDQIMFLKKTDHSRFQSDSDLELLSHLSKTGNNVSLVTYQDNNTYSCVINNPISNQTQHLDISELCHTGAVPPDSVSLIVLIFAAAAAGSLLILVSVLTCCICKKCRKKVQTQEEDRANSALCKPKSQKTKSKTEAVYENVPKKR
ncbi:hypothetical protein QQF64_019495 [Cirrhinus molitorella]|uniref:Uncharacterized protein n=1 Tax=Cirrhinus molitorella TaxID=172907 RepID=A0ABR3LIZ1_9TELE